MASQRLVPLMKETRAQYASGSPLLLEACALYNDTVMCCCIAQLKWKNIDDRPVKAAMIELDGYDAFDQKLEPVNYQYDNLLCVQGADFGTKVAVQINGTKMVRYDVILRAVSFADGSIWRSESDMPFAVLPEAEPIALSGDLLAQYRRDLTLRGIKVAGQYQPRIHQDLWQCGCGSWQKAETNCLKCRASHASLLELAQEPGLSQRLEAYNEEQERLRIEAEKAAEEARIAREKEAERRRQAAEEEARRREIARREAEARALAEKKRRRRKTVLWMLVLALLVGGYFGATKYVIPQLRYNQALELLAGGQYRQARIAFEALEGFNDSEYRVQQAEANSLFAAGSYDKVGDIYATLPREYQDHANDFSAKYNEAVKARNEGKYDLAGDIFARLGKYSDAATQVKETKYLKAKSMRGNGDYTGAAALFGELGKYSDSQLQAAQTVADRLFAEGKYVQAYDQYAALGAAYRTHDADYQVMYDAAKALQADGRYDEAKAAFASLGKFSDAAAQINECTYLKAGSLAAQKQYNEALRLFNELGRYSDSLFMAEKVKADQLYDEGKFSDAWLRYAALNEKYHTHAADYKAMYDAAAALQTQGKYDEAKAAFAALGSYGDAAAQIDHCSYLKAGALAAEGKYDEAITAYTALGYYSDSRKLAVKAQADKLYAAGEYADAWNHYVTLDAKYHTHAADYKAMFDAAEEARQKGDFDAAYDAFIALGSYPSAQEKAKQCGVDKAESLFAKEDYAAAAQVYHFIGDVNQATVSTYRYAAQLAQQGKYREAAGQYMTIRNYEDSRAQHYQMGVKAAENKQLAVACEIFSEDIEYAGAQEALYQVGKTASAEQNFAVSVAAFTKVGAYKDAPMTLTMDTYSYGDQLFAAGEYDKAAEIFKGMKGFSNTAERARESAYKAAEKALADKKYEDAVSRFTALGSYSNSATRINEARLLWAKDLFAAGELEKANTMLTDLGNYSTAPSTLKSVKYAQAHQMMDARDYAGAAAAFQELGTFMDASDRHQAARYALYTTYYEAAKYDDAIKGFESLGSYQDAAAQARKCHYDKARFLMETNRAAAYEEFLLAGDHADARQQVKTIAYEIAAAYQSGNQYELAIDWFEIAADYSDAKEQLYAIGSFFFTTQDYAKALGAFKTLNAYKDATDIMIRIGDYYSLKPDAEMAYLAYGYACLDKEPIEKFNQARTNLIYQANSYISAGKKNEARALSYTLAKIDPAAVQELAAASNFNEFRDFLKTLSKIKIGSTNWKYLTSEGNQLVFVSETTLRSCSYNDAVTWLNNTAPSTYLNDAERQFGHLWMMSKTEVERYMPSSSARSYSGGSSETWTSTSRNTTYQYTYNRSGSIGSYHYERKTYSNGVRPGLRLTYGQAMYDAFMGNPSRYAFYNKSGSAVTFKSTFEPITERLPYNYEPPKTSSYTVSNVSGASYGFKQNNSGYYVSQNKGRHNSAALCMVTFTSQTGYIYVDCINYGESGYDYGVISKVGKTLYTNNSTDSSGNVQQSFKGSSYHKSGVQTIRIPVTADKESFIYIKYQKDGSSNSGNDTLQFKIRFE